MRAHAGDDAAIYVVAPASQISRLDWLTNAEDNARADGVELVEQTAEAVPTDNVEPHVSDADPLQAIEDALRPFPADSAIILYPLLDPASENASSLAAASIISRLAP